MEPSCDFTARLSRHAAIREACRPTSSTPPARINLYGKAQEKKIKGTLASLGLWLTWNLLLMRAFARPPYGSSALPLDSSCQVWWEGLEFTPRLDHALSREWAGVEGPRPNIAFASSASLRGSAAAALQPRRPPGRRMESLRVPRRPCPSHPA